MVTAQGTWTNVLSLKSRTCYESCIREDSHGRSPLYAAAAAVLTEWRCSGRRGGRCAGEPRKDSTAGSTRQKWLPEAKTLNRKQKANEGEEGAEGPDLPVRAGRNA